MSDAHKEALARGRRESRAIKAYLEAIGRRKPGRPVTEATLTNRLATIDQQLATESNPLKRVDLQQRRIDTEAQLENVRSATDLEELESAFVAAVLGYSERKGISYAAWRAVGVPAAVLRKAGINRTA